MKRNAWLGWAILVITVMLVIVLLAVPVQAQVCNSIEQDREMIEAQGWEWLGVYPVPFTDEAQMVYYRNKTMVVISIVWGDCVLPSAMVVGKYQPQVNL